MSLPLTDSTAPDPLASRQFAEEVVRRLRRAGFSALWAGGCVRDQLLDRVPKDYDVASSATPDEVIQLFGRRRTIPVGASFGVVMVRGPNQAAGQIEVATFRSDGDYLDGRRPQSVRFSSPEEDARRRDFTINGMFFDPLQQQVIDFVGGREDLAAGIIRAIGDPSSRFAEDKLRMLRAVRFAATFGFELDEYTGQAIRAQARHLHQVSVERIAQELRRMLAHLSRERAFRLLQETQLLPVLLPQLFSHEAVPDVAVLGHRVQHCYRILSQLKTERFEPGLCALLLPLCEIGESNGGDRHRSVPIRAHCMELKLSGSETDHVVWLADSLHTLRKGAASLPLHVLKPLLADERVAGLLDLTAAVAAAFDSPAVDAEFCRRYLAEVSTDRLCPDPLIDGRDLKDLSIPSGPEFGRLLQAIRREQLDEKLSTRDQALTRLRQLVQQAAER